MTNLPLPSYFGNSTMPPLTLELPPCRGVRVGFWGGGGGGAEKRAVKEEEMATVPGGGLVSTIVVTVPQNRC
jgi:hypothetical protein